RSIAKREEFRLPRRRRMASSPRTSAAPLAPVMRRTVARPETPRLRTSIAETSPTPSDATSSARAASENSRVQRSLSGRAKEEAPHIAPFGDPRKASRSPPPDASSTPDHTSGRPRRWGLGGVPQTASLFSVWPPQVDEYTVSTSFPPLPKRRRPA